MISVIKNIQMLFHDISQPFNDRTEGNNHQHGDNAEFSAEQNGDRSDNEVVDDADHTERNVRQVGGDNEGYCIVRCSSHINIHIEGCGKDKQDQRRDQHGDSHTHRGEEVCRKDFRPDPGEKVDGISHEKHVCEGSEA